jgi:hypothetical protein
MRWTIPAALAGLVLGFGLGIFAAGGLPMLGINLSPPQTWAFASVVALCGGILGVLLQRPGRGQTVARWCLGAGLAVGGISFLAGFAGPIVFHPELPQGPLLGIFVTGPLGFLAGAVLGLIVGALVPMRARSV